MRNAVACRLRRFGRTSHQSIAGSAPDTETSRTIDGRSHLGSVRRRSRVRSWTGNLAHMGGDG
jgi:hypothetical protein